MKISFTKMHGLGNDFVMINAVKQPIELTPQQIQRISNRHFGVGCDQLLLVEPCQIADFTYRIFNANGCEVEQCGNGARCMHQFIHTEGLSKKPTLTLATKAGILETKSESAGWISVKMGVPQITSEKEWIKVNIGNPHAVILVDEVNQAPVTVIGEKLQTHSHFPQGVNVEFMKILSREAIQLRIYERHVGETQACGSGACAAVAAGIRQQLLDTNVIVKMPGGELKIQWSGDEKDALWMSGPAETVFYGEIIL